MVNNDRYQIIAIGGSWGGMDALIEILSGISSTTFIPIVVALHRHRVIESNLPHILSKYLKIKVKEIEEKEYLNNGTIYLAPRNYHVFLEKDKSFSLCVSELVNYARPSIDVLFDNVANVFKSKAIGILLTGANSDGSKGLKAISEVGGLTIVQDPLDSESRNMPLSALEIMNPDYILSKKKINKFLMDLIEL